MKGVEHYGSFKNGKLVAGTFADAVRELSRKDCSVVLTIAEFRDKRSNQANRYYWGIVVEIIYRALKESGWEITREGTHEMLRFRFLREDRPLGEHGDEFVTTVKSTTELDRDEFRAYIERCVQFAAEYLNVVIPPPLVQEKLELRG